MDSLGLWNGIKGIINIKSKNTIMIIVNLFHEIWVNINKRRNKTVKITIAGIGYVGLSNAVLLAQHNEVIALDIIKEKVDMINRKKSPITDHEIEDYLVNKALNLTATTDNYEAFKDADYVIISTPTNYDPEKNYFDTRTVETVIANVLSINPNAVMIIK